MSTVETPPVQPTGRHCPRCGVPMTDEQEWCLTCGAAVGTRIVAAPGWRTPIAIAGVILVVAAVAVAIAIVQLADDTEQVAQAPPAAVEVNPTPPAAATPVPTATPDPALTPDSTLPEASGGKSPEPTPEPTTSPEPSTSGSGSATWPAGKSGWTVVLASKTSQSEADGTAQRFGRDGIAAVGVLNSDGFSSLKPGFWVVFAGQYDNQSGASDALDGIDAKDAYIRRIVPK